MSETRLCVGLIWSEAASDRATTLETNRLAGVARALAAAGIEPVAVPYADEMAESLRSPLQALDGVLVWVNPIDHGHDRRVLDALLCDVADAGVYVSAHPDVISAIGTKEVLYRMRQLPFGSDVRLYSSMAVLEDTFPRCLAQGRPRVLKQLRGNGGIGVWKIELADPSRAPHAAVSGSTQLRVRHAARGSVEETLSLDTLIARCAVYFENDGRLIDQVYQERLTEGMVRCYLAGATVVGFGEQKINALVPAATDGSVPPPGPRLYFPPTRPDFQALKSELERDWLPALCSTCAVTRESLPVIWDADFIRGPRNARGTDSWVLCEINVSCVFPFPDEALDSIAALTRARLRARGVARSRGR